MTILLSVLLGGLVVVLCPSLLATALTWLRSGVRVLQAQLHEPAVPEAHPLTPIRPSATPTALRASVYAMPQNRLCLMTKSNSATAITERLGLRLLSVAYVLQSHSSAAVAATSAYSKAKAPPSFAKRPATRFTFRRRSARATLSDWDCSTSVVVGEARTRRPS
jgi:hypothetical protein